MSYSCLISHVYGEKIKMSEFEPAFAFMIKHEGGFINHPSDPGGATNLGISLRFLKKLKHDATINTIKELTIDSVKPIYHDYFWEPSKAFSISNQTLATKYFDFSVNMGNARAAKLLQTAYNSTIKETSYNYLGLDSFIVKDLVIDGIIGRQSLQRINKLLPLNSTILTTLYKQEAVTFYEKLVKYDPKKKVFLKGWLNRALS